MAETTDTRGINWGSAIVAGLVAAVYPSSLKEGLVMKRLSLFIAFCLMVFTMSCATMAVKSDYDRDVNFANYRTFDWMAQPQKPVTNPVAQNSLLDKRIKTAVNSKLTAKGYQQQSDNPDFLIVYHSGLKDKVDVTSWGYGYGRRGYGGGERIDVRQYKEGTLIFDFVDSKTKQLIWRGWAVGVVNNLEKTAEYIDDAVEKTLKKFPPTAG